MGNKILIEVIDGSEGKSLYINDTRVSGPKPFGGGKILSSFKVSKENLLKNIDEFKGEDDVEDNKGGEV